MLKMVILIGFCAGFSHQYGSLVCAESNWVIAPGHAVGAGGGAGWGRAGEVDVCVVHRMQEAGGQGGEGWAGWGRAGEVVVCVIHRIQEAGVWEGEGGIIFRW